MVLVRYTIGILLVSLILFFGLLPRQLPRASSAGLLRAQQAGEEKNKDKRTYTNDDWPFNRPRSTSEPAPQKGVEVVKGAEGGKVAPFVPTPMPVVEKMLEMAQVTPTDVIYDLGSGDGRIVIHAAQRYGAKGVGVELDRNLAQESADQVRELKLGDQVTIIQGDLFQANIKPATVVTVYLLPGANDKLRPMLERDLKPGSRVVAHDIRIPGWRWARTEAVEVGGGTHFIYLYQIPDAFGK